MESILFMEEAQAVQSCANSADLKNLSLYSTSLKTYSHVSVLHLKSITSLVNSNINAISISGDSQFAAIGSSNGDYRVKIIDLWKKKVVHDLNSIHTCK
jgi:hypothetical protein